MEEYRLIRGARILQQLDEDSTATQLRQNIVTSFPHTRKRQNATNEVNVANVQYIPYVGTKMLHVKSSTRSNGHEYKQAVQFMRVVFAGADGPDNVTFTASDNQEYHVQPIALMNHNVKVRCNCLDFYYRFATWNYNDNSIVGRAPIPYQRKTQNHPEVNPDHVPGMCKHLLKLMDRLRSERLIQ